MSKLRIFEHISLDGIIQVSSTPGEEDFPYDDWTARYRTPAGFALVTEMYGEAFDLVLGRRTYDQWSSFWPHAPKNPMAERLCAATKYVVTHRPESLEWGPFRAVGSDFVDVVRRLKADGSKDLILSGSGSLTSAVIEHGLVDELILFVNPVLLGQGKRIFAEGTPAHAFTFDRSKAMPSGTLINIYKAAGPLLARSQS